MDEIVPKLKGSEKYQTLDVENSRNQNGQGSQGSQSQGQVDLEFVESQTDERDIANLRNHQFDNQGSSQMNALLNIRDN